MDNFDAAKGLYDEAHRSLQTVVGDVIFKIISRDAGKSAALEEAERQIESLKKEVAERGSRIAELEAAATKAAEQIESLKAAVSHLDNEIRKGQELTAQAAKVAGLEARLKIYEGIEATVPQLRTMRENAEAMNRSLPQS
jgi:chromosome segregation ATPase